MRRAALAAAAALALVTLARLPDGCASGNALNHVSGAWMTLADDLARGTFYRPLRFGDAYGGTRYFPLTFAVQAGLRRAGLGPVAAGQLASLAAGALLAVALLLLVRRSGAGWANAAAAAGLGFAGFAGQHALLSARGDLLPAALVAAALAVLAAESPASPGRLAWAAALAALAFAAKPTALAGAAAGVAFLAIRGERRLAAFFTAATAAGAALSLVGIEALSSGRFGASLAALGAAGATPRSLVAAAPRLAGELAIEDPSGLVLCIAAALVAGQWLARGAFRSGHDPRLLPALWVLASFATTLLVYGIPGTGVNHLVDAEAASAALIGSSLASRREGLARAGALASALAGVALALVLWRADGAGSRLAEARAVLRAVPRDGSIVSEDPLVPLLAGRSPLLLDAFALRLAAARNPALTAPLASDLGRAAFPAVVLLADVDGRANAAGALGDLGPSLLPAIRSGYRHAGTFGPYHLYLPRGPALPEPGVARREPTR